MKRALAFFLLAAAMAPVAAQELGRLFFTEEQRAALDARRRARVPDKPVAPTVASPTTRLDGYVRRSDGPSTVWVNGESHGVEGRGAPRIESGQRDGRVSVPVGEGGGTVRFSLKPGQAIDRGTGEVRDVLGPNGELRVSPAR
jgi:hypothetical protein